MAAEEVGRGRRHTQRRAYWRAQVEQWRRSGQSKGACARRHGLSAASFYRWCGKLAEGEGQAPAFIPLRLPVVAEGSYLLGLRLAEGRVLRVAEGADPVWASRLVRELEGPC